MVISSDSTVFGSVSPNFLPGSTRRDVERVRLASSPRNSSRFICIRYSRIFLKFISVLINVQLTNETGEGVCACIRVFREILRSKEISGTFSRYHLSLQTDLPFVVIYKFAFNNYNHSVRVRVYGLKFLRFTGINTVRTCGVSFD